MTEKQTPEWMGKGSGSELKPGRVAFLDNLSSHKGPRGSQLTEAAGASPSTCRRNSPDFNPIENAFASPPPCTMQHDGYCSSRERNDEPTFAPDQSLGLINLRSA